MRWEFARFLRALRCGLSSNGCLDSVPLTAMSALLEVQFRPQKSLRIKTVAKRCALVVALVSSGESGDASGTPINSVTEEESRWKKSGSRAISKACRPK